jgi:hypothetical protein
MRLLLGIILGCALTVGSVYVADTMGSGSPTDRMVNWNVVAKHVDSVSAMARDGWKKIAG